MRLPSCPFCGKDKILRIMSSSDYDEYYEYEDKFQVVCDFGESGCGASSGFRDTEDEAIEAWTMRSPSTLEV